MKGFRELQVWQKSHALVLKLYRVTRSFPADERFGLTSQLRRAARGVPTNVAEGCGRSTDAELARFADIACGSASEVEYELLLAHDLEYIDKKTYAALTKDLFEIKRMLVAYVRYLRHPTPKASKSTKRSNGSSARATEGA